MNLEFKVISSRGNGARTDVLEQQWMSDIAQMLQRRMHLHDHLQGIWGFACLFQVAHCDFLNDHFGVIQLGQQQS